MKQIPLTRGKFAIVDDEDFVILSFFNWHCDPHGYAIRKLKTSERAHYNHKTHLRMHRAILGANEGDIVDHLNGDRADNRRCNLRICTNSENSRNRHAPIKNRSGLMGVHWAEHAKMWRVRLWVNNKFIHVGYFKDKYIAQEAYNKAFKQYFQDIRKPNKIKRITLPSMIYVPLLDKLGRRNRKHPDKQCPICFMIFKPNNGGRDIFCSKKCAYTPGARRYERKLSRKEE